MSMTSKPLMGTHLGRDSPQASALQCGVHRLAVQNEVRLGSQKFFQECVDLIRVNVGGEPVDRGIDLLSQPRKKPKKSRKEPAGGLTARQRCPVQRSDAAWVCTKQKSAGRKQIGQNLEVGDTPGVGGIWFIASDALEVVL